MKNTLKRGCAWLAAAIVLASGAAVRADDAKEIAVTIENHLFQPKEIKVAAGAPFILVVENKDAAVEEFESKDLRVEKIVPAGKSVRIHVPALKAGVFKFVGEYHEDTAIGQIVVE